MNDDLLDTASDLADPPTGGRWKLAILGIIVPAAIAAWAVNGWISEETFWPAASRHGGNLKITGESASHLSAVYFSCAAFCHFHWCWGLLGWRRASLAGIALSMLTGFSFLAIAFFKEMAM